MDLMSDYFVVLSDMCFHCGAKNYIPGHSKTTKDLGTLWQLDYESQPFDFKVIEFTDTVCFGDSCLNKQHFYTPYEMTGKFPKKIDGLLGVGTKYSDEPSLIKELVR